MVRAGQSSPSVAGSVHTAVGRKDTRTPQAAQVPLQKGPAPQAPQAPQLGLVTQQVLRLEQENVKLKTLFKDRDVKITTLEAQIESLETVRNKIEADSDENRRNAVEQKALTLLLQRQYAALKEQVEARTPEGEAQVQQVQGQAEPQMGEDIENISIRKPNNEFQPDLLRKRITSLEKECAALKEGMEKLEVALRNSNEAKADAVEHLDKAHQEALSLQDDLKAAQEAAEQTAKIKSRESTSLQHIDGLEAELDAIKKTQDGYVRRVRELETRSKADALTSDLNARTTLELGENLEVLVKGMQDQLDTAIAKQRTTLRLYRQELLEHRIFECALSAAFEMVPSLAAKTQISKILEGTRECFQRKQAMVRGHNRTPNEVALKVEDRLIETIERDDRTSEETIASGQPQSSHTPRADTGAALAEGNSASLRLSLPEADSSEDEPMRESRKRRRLNTERTASNRPLPPYLPD